MQINLGFGVKSQKDPMALRSREEKYSRHFSAFFLHFILLLQYKDIFYPFCTSIYIQYSEQEIQAFVEKKKKLCLLQTYFKTVPE